MLWEANRRNRKCSVVRAVFGGWPTCWLAGREARLVWGSVVLVQMQFNSRFWMPTILLRTSAAHTQNTEAAHEQGSDTDRLLTDLHNLFIKCLSWKALQTLLKKKKSHAILSGWPPRDHCWTETHTCSCTREHPRKKHTHSRYAWEHNAALVSGYAGCLEKYSNLLISHHFRIKSVHSKQTITKPRVWEERGANGESKPPTVIKHEQHPKLQRKSLVWQAEWHFI